MRIVAGEFRSRRLVAPAGRTRARRPIGAREALFAMLADVEGARVLDCFAGSGALGLEALSRGAATCTFVERDRGALAALRANVEALDVGDRCTVRASRRPPVAACRCRGGPPVRSVPDRSALPYADATFSLHSTDFSAISPRPAARLALESAAGDEPVVRGFQLDRRRRAGAASLSLFTRTEEPL